MKRITGNERRQEGERYRLYSVIECDQCGHVRYERKPKLIQKVLDSPCVVCRAAEQRRLKEENSQRRREEQALKAAERARAKELAQAEKERLRAAAIEKREWEKYHKKCRTATSIRWKFGYALEDLSSTYYGMISRCYNENQPGYEHWGGRGIRVCLRWLIEPFRFMEDMGPKPSAEYSIDRIDQDGDYEPSNCRWAASKEQNRNRRSCSELLTPEEKEEVRRAQNIIGGFKRRYGDDWMAEGNARCAW